MKPVDKTLKVVFAKRVKSNTNSTSLFQFFYTHSQIESHFVCGLTGDAFVAKRGWAFMAK